MRQSGFIHKRTNMELMKGEALAATHGWLDLIDGKNGFKLDDNGSAAPIEKYLMPTKENKIRVGIVASSRLVRDYLPSIVQGSMEVAFSISRATLLETYDAPNVLLVDAGDLDYAAVAALSKRVATVRVVIINADHDALDLIECARIGVSGFTLKESGPDNLTETIHSVYDNRKVIPAKIANRLYEQLATTNDRGARFHDADLTVREHQIVELIAQGLTNKEIAQRLNIALDTAKTHVHNILRKIGCRRRVDLFNPLHCYSAPQDLQPPL